MRLYLTYGPNQDYNRIIPITINNFINEKKFSLTNCNQIRDFLYVNDLIELLIKVIKKKPNNEIYNVGAGNKLKVKMVIDTINDIIKLGNPQFGKIEMRKDEMKNNFPDISKIKKYYNWSPKTNIKLGLKKTISFYENN